MVPNHGQGAIVNRCAFTDRENLTKGRIAFFFAATIFPGFSSIPIVQDRFRIPEGICSYDYIFGIITSNVFGVVDPQGVDADRVNLRVIERCTPRDAAPLRGPAGPYRTGVTADDSVIHYGGVVTRKNLIPSVWDPVATA
jgi:hypothetical protein